MRYVTDLYDLQDKCGQTGRLYSHFAWQIGVKLLQALPTEWETLSCTRLWNLQQSPFYYFIPPPVRYCTYRSQRCWVCSAVMLCYSLNSNPFTYLLQFRYQLENWKLLLDKINGFTYWPLQNYTWFTSLFSYLQ